MVEKRKFDDKKENDGDGSGDRDGPEEDDGTISPLKKKVITSQEPVSTSADAHPAKLEPTKSNPFFSIFSKASKGDDDWGDDDKEMRKDETPGKAVDAALRNHMEGLKVETPAALRALLPVAVDNKEEKDPATPPDTFDSVQLEKSSTTKTPSMLASEATNIFSNAKMKPAFNFDAANMPTFGSFASAANSKASFADLLSTKSKSSFSELLSTPSKVLGKVRGIGQDDEDEDNDEEKENDDGSDNNETVELGKTGTIPEPPLLETKTGEEDETVVYSAHGKLFWTHGAEKQWREKGSGTFRINSNPNTKAARLVMRTDGIHKLILNVRIIPQMPCSISQDRFITFVSSEEASGGTVKYLFKTANNQIATTILHHIKEFS
ncbi:hypothetical protein BC829DRAFT_386401 [Chytridium lagenaria]|nr:hypothetical protein BC829DRAFT_386401 [Chytridium lagenaria]